MRRNRVWIRALLGVLLVAACLAAAIAPALTMVQAAPPQARASASLPPGNLVISSFRFEGAAGTTDEYIAIYNRSCNSGDAVDLSTYQLRASSGNSPTHWTFALPAGASVQPGQYYVIGGAQYTPVTGEPTANVQYPPVDDADAVAGGIGLFDGSGNQVDAVGFNDSGGGYFEGTALGPLTSNESYFRKTFPTSPGGQFVDSNDNSADFQAQASGTAWPATCGTPTVTISGTITGAGASVTVAWTRMTELTGSTTAPASDASGNYTITVPANWTGMVTPSKTGYTFTPAFRTYADLMENQVTQNYAATAAATPSNTASGFSPRVLINEIAWYGVRSSVSSDWIELYNNTDAPIDLSGWTLFTGAGLIPQIVLTGTIPARGFYLLAHAPSSSYATNTPTVQPTPACLLFKPADHISVDQWFYGDLRISGEKLFLHDAAGNPIDSANAADSSWRAGSTTFSASMERRGVVPDTSTAWITYANPGGNTTVHDCSGLTVYGTPKQPNWALGKVQTPTPRPTRTNTPPPPTPFGHMVINEFLPRAGYDWNQDGSVDVYDEFIELYNLGPVNANLNGWKIDVISPGGNTSYGLSGLTLKPGDRMVFYHLKTQVELPDLGGTVRLINNRNVIVDARGYDPVQAPDQSTCRIPDGLYWKFPCFPTPGNVNSLTGTHPVPPPAIASLPPPCVMSDVVPTPFRMAECYPFGADIYNPAYWDDQSGFKQFPVPDVLNKWRAVVQ